jgi:hypothetical protein
MKSDKISRKKLIKFLNECNEELNSYRIGAAKNHSYIKADRYRVRAEEYIWLVNVLKVKDFK